MEMEHPSVALDYPYKISLLSTVFYCRERLL